MNCPACRHGLPAGPHESCPFCGTRLSGPVDGALATEPAPTPDPQSPIREIPGMRKRERTWKDEVRDRVRDRREKRGSDLPLFREGEGEDAAAGASAAMTEEPPPDPQPAADAEDIAESVLGRDGDPEPAGPHELGEQEVDDLVLATPPDPDEGERVRANVDASPVERPALPFERLLAAAVDLAVLVAVWAAVVYFASRVARVPLRGLWPTWPWMAAYLGALGLLYAGYFTGTTGQTLGKMVHRLHVLDVAGGPPGHLRAVARALLGSLGVLLAGGGLLPMLFDPARRTLHDRLLRTRVIRL